MGLIVKLASFACALGIVSSASAAISTAQCNRDYDKCKSNVKYLFNKKHCKKERNKCNAQVAKAEKNNATKRAMMSGKKEQAPNDYQAWKSKEEAKRRLAEREQMQGQSAQPTSMKEKMLAREQTPEDKKAAAIRRMRERNGQAQGEL